MIFRQLIRMAIIFAFCATAITVFAQNMTGMPYGAQPISPPVGMRQAPSRGYGGEEGVMPFNPDAPSTDIYPPMARNPEAFLPFGSAGNIPNWGVMRSSFAQVNNQSDPFNPNGMLNQRMYMPWSTPLMGWTNAQVWNWWREHSGAMPHNW